LEEFGCDPDALLLEVERIQRIMQLRAYLQAEDPRFARILDLIGLRHEHAEMAAALEMGLDEFEALLRHYKRAVKRFSADDLLDEETDVQTTPEESDDGDA
jgi:hypothetical protein